LLLKTLHAGGQAAAYWELLARFQQEYQQQLSVLRPGLPLAELSRRSLLHLGGCLLARVDGKSPVDYLDASQQESARGIGRDLLCRRIDSWDTVGQRVLSLAPGS
jgi:hypothetical protein